MKMETMVRTPEKSSNILINCVLHRRLTNPSIVQRSIANQGRAQKVPPTMQEMMQSTGQPLDPKTRYFMESRLDHDISQVTVNADASQIVLANDRYEKEADQVADRVTQTPPSGTPDLQPPIKKYDLSRVRVHANARAAESARAFNALAFTFGRDIFFDSRKYAPETNEGRRLLAHELAHVLQQNSTSKHHLMKKNGPQIRSPVFEEAVTQISTIEASVHGRNLGPREVSLARSVFGNSVDYARVSLIPSRLLTFHTVGNTIRVPINFTAENALMAERFIHEMTHVWQYQHVGTSYISGSLSDQLMGAIQTGSRFAAYLYHIVPGKTFFDYRVEQQAFIVHIYFRRMREQANPTISPSLRSQIAQDIALLQPLIDQMRAAMPRSEVDILTMRASESISESTRGFTQGFTQEEIEPERERRAIPIRPLLEFRF